MNELHICALIDKAKKPPPSPASKVKEERGKDKVKLAGNSNTRQPPPQEVSVEEIREFFGEAKKSSAKQLLLVVVDDSEEDSEFETAKEGRQSDSDESEEMETMLRETAKDAEFSLEELIQKRLRYLIFMFKECILSTYILVII